MRLSVVCDLIAHPWLENKLSTVFKLCVQLAFHAQQDVAFDAPMIGAIAGRVFDHANANTTKVQRLPISQTAFTIMFGSLYFGPGCCSEWNL